MSPANADAAAAPAAQMYFTAGPNHGTGGLLGYLTAVSAELTTGTRNKQDLSVTAFFVVECARKWIAFRHEALWNASMIAIAETSADSALYTAPFQVK